MIAYISHTSSRYFRSTIGLARISADGAIVSVEGHRTIANSNDAHAWIDEHVTDKAERRDMLRATHKPESSRILSPIDNIATRKKRRKELTG